MSSGYRGRVQGGLLAAALSITVAPAPALAAAASTEIGNITSGYPGRLSLNGTAMALPGGRLRVTGGGFQQAGSAWSADQVDVSQSFGTTFRAFLHGRGSGNHGD